MTCAATAIANDDGHGGADHHRDDASGALRDGAASASEIDTRGDDDANRNDEETASDPLLRVCSKKVCASESQAPSSSQRETNFGAKICAKSSFAEPTSANLTILNPSSHIQIE
jgi:hypothetical protein